MKKQQLLFQNSQQKKNFCFLLYGFGLLVCSLLLIRNQAAQVSELESRNFTNLFSQFCLELKCVAGKLPVEEQFAMWPLKNKIYNILLVCIPSKILDYDMNAMRFAQQTNYVYLFQFSGAVILFMMLLNVLIKDKMFNKFWLAIMLLCSIPVFTLFQTVAVDFWMMSLLLVYVLTLDAEDKKFREIGRLMGCVAVGISGYVLAFMMVTEKGFKQKIYTAFCAVVLVLLFGIGEDYHIWQYDLLIRDMLYPLQSNRYMVIICICIFVLSGLFSEMRIRTIIAAVFVCILRSGDMSAFAFLLLPIALLWQNLDNESDSFTFIMLVVLLITILPKHTAFLVRMQSVPNMWLYGLGSILAIILIRKAIQIVKK